LLLCELPAFAKSFTFCPRRVVPFLNRGTAVVVDLFLVGMAHSDIRNNDGGDGLSPITAITRIGPTGLSAVKGGYSLSGITEKLFYASSGPERAFALTETAFVLVFRTAAPYVTRPLSKDIMQQLDREHVPAAVMARCPCCAGAKTKPCYLCPSIPWLTRVYCSIAPYTQSAMEQLLRMVYTEYDRQMKARALASAVPLECSLLAACEAMSEYDKSRGVAFNFPGEYNGPDLITLSKETLRDPDLTDDKFHLARAKVVDDHRRNVIQKELARPITHAEQAAVVAAVEYLQNKKRKCALDEDAPTGRSGSALKTPSPPPPAQAPAPESKTPKQKTKNKSTAAAVATPVAAMEAHLENCLRAAPKNSAFMIHLDQVNSTDVERHKALFKKMVDAKKKEEAKRFARSPRFVNGAELAELRKSMAADTLEIEAELANPALITEKKLKEKFERLKKLDGRTFYLRMMFSRLVLARAQLCAEIGKRAGSDAWLKPTQVSSLTVCGRIAQSVPNAAYLDPKHYSHEWLRRAEKLVQAELNEFKTTDPHGFHSVWEVPPTDQPPPPLHARAIRPAAAAAAATVSETMS
jgi:hypothetical protein